MKIIGLTGYALSGKTTVAKQLGGTVLPFAEQLRYELHDFIYEQYGWSVWDLTPEQKEIVRPYMVAHGAGRHALDPIYWVKAWDCRARSIPGLIVVDDVRYLNEVKFIEQQGGKVIRILRPGYIAPNDEERDSIQAIIEARPQMIVVRNDCEMQEFLERVRRAA